ncbi:PAS domain S-box protein [Geomesophilobacter sediminis]|uniref:histidine kinase n=1 Tax=Geomesophilobacter sediminis TaxID=2798584 RepID=A0A8J7J0P1_9BACT|nr:PAS domain S-box protein [Geomesophilobacter sediminis]MBJ6724003.1 PAS domain S-box protein [Geomesophilobacter sediminis]
MKQAIRILIIDDSPEDATLIALQLQKEFEPSYERVQTAEELEQALDRGGWQLVISDFVMPGFSGLAALKLLQDRDLDLPLIMVSGQMGEDLAVEAMRAGAQDYLVKNNLTRLIPAVKRELNEAVVRRERRLAQEALVATEARLQCLVEQSLVGIFMLQGGRFSYVNPKFAQIFAYPQDSLTGQKSLLDLVAREDQFRVMAQFLRPLEEAGGNIHVFCQGVRSDGAMVDLEMNGSRTELNGHPAIIGTLLDITERKHAEAELSKLWQAVEQSPVSVVITDIMGNIEYVNPKFCEVTGYDETEVAGKNPRILKSGTMDKPFYQDLWATITDGREWHGELHNKKKSGELFWESASISAVKNGDGRITHFVAVKENITERKRGIEQMRQAQKMEAIGQLAGGIAHDFNNLLTIINGYSTLLIRSLEYGTPMRKEAEQILRAGERAADLTRQLLSFSRRQIMEPKVLNINEQVRSIETMLRRLIGENIELVAGLLDDVGYIKCDPGQIEQIIMNLVLNARDASDTGGKITIETGNDEIDENFAMLHPGAVPGSYVRLSVSDDGVGMSDEVKRRIFEPFFTTKEMGRGTGLGLATVYGIVKQSGGYIEVISQPNQGTQFNIFLPRVFKKQASAKKPMAEEIAGMHTQTILVVEDEPGVLNLVVHTLKKQGFRIIETTDPLQGVTLFDEHQSEIDLLLTDVVMPFMSGPKLAEQLTQKNPKLKVLFMSGHTDNNLSFEKILENGVPFLPKPFAGDALIKKVTETLGNGSEAGKPDLPPGGSF